MRLITPAQRMKIITSPLSIYNPYIHTHLFVLVVMCLFPLFVQAGSPVTVDGLRDTRSFGGAPHKNHIDTLGSTIVSRVHEIYVSPAGRDSNEGSLLNPVATLAGARDLIRDLKVFNIYIDIRSILLSNNLLSREEI